MHDYDPRNIKAQLERERAERAKVPDDAQRFNFDILLGVHDKTWRVEVTGVPEIDDELRLLDIDMGNGLSKTFNLDHVIQIDAEEL